MGSMNKRTAEVLRFVITGGVCFLIELAALVLLRDKVGLDTLVATPIAFLLSVAVNYALCVRWVFTGTGDQKASAKLGFLVTSAMGLVLNEGLMWLFRSLLGEDAVVCRIFSLTITMVMLNKALATLIVMVWNYFTKRAILNRASRGA